ncbi:MAG: MMPL family transporter, partial [Verrucomicrobiota bacterium]
YVLPSAFIPRRAAQEVNAETIRALLGERTRLLEEMNEAGFSEDGTRLTATVFDSWQAYLETLSAGGFALPTGKLAEWSIDRLYAEREGTFAALATVKPTHPRDREWVGAICSGNTVVASLGSLGTALNERIGQDLTRVFLPMMGLLAIMLGLVFRHWKDLLLSLFSLLFTAGVLVLLTIWTPMSWNSFNVCGLPLLFGTGLDFSIHMILALRRSGGDVAKARHGIGKALVFCGTSSAIGFGSLATASAYGLASLGIVCAIGIFVNMMVAVWLLPRWYRWAHRHDRVDQPASPVR